MQQSGQSINLPEETSGQQHASLSLGQNCKRRNLWCGLHASCGPTRSCLPNLANKLGAFAGREGVSTSVSRRVWCKWNLLQLEVLELTQMNFAESCKNDSVWWGMLHFSKSSWDEDCSLLNTFGHTVIPKTFPKIPISSGWQGGFLGHRYKLLSPQRAHCTELHNRLNREISRWALRYWMLLVLSKTKRAIFFALHTSKTCESPIPDRNHTARCNWKKASALHGEWDTAGWQLAEDTLCLCSLVPCWKLTIRLNYFQQSSKHTSLAFAWWNLLHD